MVTVEMKEDARKTLLESWGDVDGARVIGEAEKVQPFNGGFNDFLSHCFAQGGDWGAMLLTGVHSLWPAVWDAIPDDMGPFAFTAICNTLILCGVDTRE